MSKKLKSEDIIVHPCYACHEGSGRHRHIAVLERRTPEGVKYECGLGKNECSVVEIYRMFSSHRHGIIKRITTKPIVIKKE